MNKKQQLKAVIEGYKDFVDELSKYLKTIDPDSFKKLVVNANIIKECYFSDSKPLIESVVVQPRKTVNYFMIVKEFITQNSQKLSEKLESFIKQMTNKYYITYEQAIDLTLDLVLLYESFSMIFNDNVAFKICKSYFDEAKNTLLKKHV